MENREILTELLRINNRLLDILEKFAEAGTNISVTAGNPVVNSYNGSSAAVENEQMGENGGISNLNTSSRM